MRLIKTSLSFFLFVLCSAVFASNRFLTISDLHFNPFDRDNVYPVANKDFDEHNDTNEVYLESVVDSMAYVATHYKVGDKVYELDKNDYPKFIVITGDLLAHKFEAKLDKNFNRTVCFKGDEKMSVRDCILQSIDTIITQIRKKDAFMSIPIYIAVGNNDSDLGDYSVDQPFLKKLGGKFSTYSHSTESKFAENFAAHGGAYQIIGIPNVKPQLNLVSLNTVLYADKLLDDKQPELGLQLKCIAPHKGEPNDDCQYLRTQQNAFIKAYVDENSAKTLVITHIAPYLTTKGYNANATPYLSDSIFKLSGAFNLAGHWHEYHDYQELSKTEFVDKKFDEKGKVIVENYKPTGFMLNSITFRKGVKPGFSVFNFDGALTEKVHCEIPASDAELSGKKPFNLPFSCLPWKGEP